MKCNNEAVELMHKYLDGDITKEQEQTLSQHLESCDACQRHFHELKRTITFIQSAEQIKAPANFTATVMEKLPTEKKRIKYTRWFKAHPMLTAAAIFFVFMLSGMLSVWNQDSELVVSKQEDLVINGDTVIVPQDVTVDGDLLVKNGNLIINGTIDGNVTLINGKLIEEPIEGEGLMASVGEVNGELKHVDQVFEWIWYSIKQLFQSVFAL
ncbi:anti-sigma factor [Agaribacter marinus]|uniref:Anti-sigma-W factor RsiW n=1 Tax=Virgibacillus salarius TaxID=447199 RepID=A0A941I9W4_9BACI|nr:MULTISPECIES: zf-HC2 domain-containing protein [Bacillaceae]MBR7797194.1 anti-sigma factor [Virgibacillus salarius]MDY7045970.1 zf-HC2 domain-containing protein [Virgibacillus sp. M23]NAZ09903.1 anti-sigma factor [Agaribacter marinus]WBX81069.1 zf-HC2 domain-containing protein [Virgibacillus salarius]